MLIDRIKELSKNIHQQVVAHRQYLHANPELSFQEYNTSSYVKKTLDELGVSYTASAVTGVLGIIKGDLPSHAVIALRADMDALPITEMNDLPYQSTNKGVMHACGHDVHTSSLLGVAKILQTLKSDFGGTIKLIFQPAEEKIPGGANQMIKEGVLENPRPDVVMGQHVMPSLPVGKVGVREGKYMASSDEIYMTIRGKGGHGAQPQQNIDPVVIASQIVVALQQVVSRFADPRIPTVLSFGKFIANGATNIIPNEVYLEGTFRTMDESWRAEAHKQIRTLVQGMAESMGATAEVNILNGYPFLINNPALCADFKRFATAYAGAENVVDLDTWMAAEDFAYYSHQIDSCFYLLGVGNVEKGITAALHTPTFNVDEDAMEISTGLMTYLALKRLGN